MFCDNRMSGGVSIIYDSYVSQFEFLSRLQVCPTYDTSIILARQLINHVFLG